LTLKEWRSLSALGARMLHRRGHVLCAEGDRCVAVTLIVTGAVKVCRSDSQGRSLLLGFRGAGELVDEIAAVDGAHHRSTATCVEPCDVLSVERAGFLHFMGQTERASLLMLQQLAARLRDSDEKRLEFTSLDATERVAARLHELGREFGRISESGLTLDLTVSLAELAGWAGCSRYSVTRALHVLQGHGVIVRRRGRITMPRAGA
jgi:CRP-like cAMP-binding protein